MHGAATGAMKDHRLSGWNEMDAFHASEVHKGAADDALTGAIAAIHTKFEKVEKACGGMHSMPGMTL